VRPDPSGATPLGYPLPATPEMSEAFNFVTVLYAVVIGIGLTQLLNGIVRLTRVAEQPVPATAIQGTCVVTIGSLAFIRNGYWHLAVITTLYLLVAAIGVVMFVGGPPASEAGPAVPLNPEVVLDAAVAAPETQ